MANHVIVCVIKSNSPKSSSYTASGCHITDVGLDNGQMMTVKDVYVSIDAGNTFQTMYPVAHVAQYRCESCGVETLRSHADRAWNNNLDNLRICS